MKKYFGLIFCFLFLVTGCSKVRNSSNAKISVVCTTFPVYDWARNISEPVKDKINLVLIQKSGADLHNFQPSAEDIISIRSSDLFIYVGGESDGWVQKVILPENNVLNLFETDFPKILEASDDDKPEYDEHIWLSLKNAEIFCTAISDKLCELFPEQNDEIKKALSDYSDQLTKLDAEFSMKAMSVSSDPQKSYAVVLADRNPFAYFARDYGLQIFAAFKGCSAESEASFEKIADLVQALKFTNSKNIFILEDNSGEIARTVIQNAEKEGEVKIRRLNSLQSVNQRQISEGAAYLSLFKTNMAVFEN